VQDCGRTFRLRREDKARNDARTEAELQGQIVSRYRAVIPRATRIALQDNPFLSKRTAYKFHHECHRESILGGTIKIGRLSDYREIERTALRDQDEGVSVVSMETDVLMSQSKFHQDSIARKVCPMNNADETIRFANVLFRLEHPDLYLYCFYYECSNEVLESFINEKPYDDVAICLDIFSVAEIVCKYHPFLRGSRYLCLPVIYRERHRSPSEASSLPTEEVFEKPTRFQANKKGRIVFFSPASQKDRPALGLWQHPELAKLFRSYPMPTPDCRKRSGSPHT